MEGILVRGELPEFNFEADNNCYRSRVCQPGECIGEDVTRSTEFSQLIQSTLFLRADANGDKRVNIGDAHYSLRFLFQAGDDPVCADAADANDDGNINLSDPIFTLDYLFRGGRTMPTPFRDCGIDTTDNDQLTCEVETPNCQSS